MFDDVWLVFNGMVYNIIFYFFFYFGGEEDFMWVVGRDGIWLFSELGEIVFLELIIIFGD